MCLSFIKGTLTVEEPKDNTQGFMPPGADTMRTGFTIIQETPSPQQPVKKAKVQGLAVGAINEYVPYPLVLMHYQVWFFVGFSLSAVAVHKDIALLY